MMLQVLNRVCLLIALIALLGVIAIFAVLMARGEGAGYSIVTCFVIYLAALPIGMPVVTTAVLAIGARQMAKEKAIVSRQADRLSLPVHNVFTRSILVMSGCPAVQSVPTALTRFGCVSAHVPSVRCCTCLCVLSYIATCQN